MSRLLLTLAVVAVFALGAAGMWWGWRHRVRRQAQYLPPLPEPPVRLSDVLLLPELRSVYLGSTTAGDWQDRIAVGGVGLRAGAALRLSEDGLLVDRDASGPLWIPAESLLGARTDRACAGKVVGPDGLLVVRWLLGDHELDSGFVAADKDRYGDWLIAVASLVTRRAYAGLGPEGSGS